MSAQRSLFDRFWEKVDVRGDAECWPWLAAKAGKAGYGCIGIRGHWLTRAHCISWMLANHREVPEGLWVLHTCDNPPCVNPAHLFLGTRQDNVDDMMAKRRHGAHRGLVDFARGERHGIAKLTEAEVLEIRRRRDLGEMQQALADSFGVSRRTIGFIVNRETWVHI